LFAIKSFLSCKADGSDGTGGQSISISESRLLTASSKKRRDTKRSEVTVFLSNSSHIENIISSGSNGP
jgi:hypothetical protein